MGKKIDIITIHVGVFLWLLGSSDAAIGGDMTIGKPIHPSL